MQNILCFGDSNTWGAIPGSSARHPWAVRWPGVLQNLLGNKCRVVEEGLGGRTTCWDDPLDFGRNGRTYLPVALETHAPIDLLIVMLGTNDVKSRFGLTAFSIGQGAAELLQVAKKFEPQISEVLLIAPPHIVQTTDVENSLAFEHAIEKSIELASHYRYFAEKHDCHFFDGATVASSSPIDGIHLDAEAHGRLADGIHARVCTIRG